MKLIIIAFGLGVVFALTYVFIGMELGLVIVPFVNKRYRCYFERYKRYYRQKNKDVEL